MSLFYIFIQTYVVLFVICHIIWRCLVALLCHFHGCLIVRCLIVRCLNARCLVARCPVVLDSVRSGSSSTTAGGYFLDFEAQIPPADSIFFFFFFKLFLFLEYRVRHHRSSTPAHFKIHSSVCRRRIESVITFHLSVGI